MKAFVNAHKMVFANILKMPYANAHKMLFPNRRQYANEILLLPVTKTAPISVLKNELLSLGFDPSNGVPI